MEPARLWEDKAELVPSDQPDHAPIVLRYPDGSTTKGWRAFVCGVSELVYRPEVNPGLLGGVVVETFADVHLDEDVDDGRFYAARLRDAVAVALDRLERAGSTTTAAELREAATLAGFPPAVRNPLA